MKTTHKLKTICLFPAIDVKSDNTIILAIKDSSDDIILLNAQEEVSIDTPPILKKLAIEQALDTHCEAASPNVCYAGSEFDNDQRRLLATIPIADKSVQIVAPTLLRARNRYLAHHLQWQET